MSKLISLDLDGTLLNSKKEVSEYNLRALKDFKNGGGTIVFATARPLRVVLPVLPEVLHKEVIICYNGGEIYEDMKKIIEFNISEDEVKRIVLEFSKKWPNRFIGIETPERLYTNQEVIKLFAHEEYTIVDLNEFEYQSSSKILLHMEGIEASEVEAILGRSYKLIVSDKGVLGQISLENVNKLAGLKSVLTRKEIDIVDAIAFGDDFNDYEIIKGVGTGVAMGNAEEGIKDIADAITKSNNEDGIAHYLYERVI